MTNESLIGADVLNNTPGGDDVDESTLGQVPSALYGGLGRNGSINGCDPGSATDVTCDFIDLNLRAPARALVLGRATASSNFDGGEGNCALATVPGGTVPGSVGKVIIANDVFAEDFSMSGITGVLPAGVTRFALDCNQTEGPTQYSYTETVVTAVVISPG